MALPHDRIDWKLSKELIKAAAQSVGDATKVAAKAGREALKTGSDALNGTAKFVRERQPRIAATTQAAMETGGKAIQATGEALEAKASSISRDLRTSDEPASSQATKAFQQGGAYGADALGALGRLTGRLGALARKISPALGGATGSAVSGIATAVSATVDSVAITDHDFEAMRDRLRLASAAVRTEAERKEALIRDAQQQRSKKDLLDLLVVGGVALSAIVSDPARTPAEVEQAFALAYPNIAAAGETFAHAVERIPAEDLIGLVSGVKGKLFEVELVDDLNSGGLPEGIHAELANSATQPGFDVRILDGDGHTVDLLQAKATESAAYVREALDRYPAIDVTTTSEVYAQLAAVGALDRVSDSGISEHVLQANVEGAIAAGDQFDAGDLVPSSVGLAVIALSSFRDQDLSLEERGADFGDRAAKAGVAGVAANVALVSTSVWWVAVIAGMGSRWLTTYGGNKRQRYEALERAVGVLESRVTFAP